MIPLPLDEIAALQLGELELDDGADQITGVQVDSRRIVPGDLFVAIGEGERFRDDAYARGAVAALVPSDAFAAMAALGRAVRARSRARVVAITGSYGKTTTKDILASIAIPQRPTVAAERSFNNEIGVPLTLCRLEPQTEICITELAMRGFGQIAELAELTRPEIGVVVTIGPVHLEKVGRWRALSAPRASSSRRCRREARRSCRPTSPSSGTISTSSGSGRTFASSRSIRRTCARRWQRSRSALPRATSP
jgi:UDP-N-acetylmuramoyl-tripeptide--D-alanyl-D-alanine ligase